MTNNGKMNLSRKKKLLLKTRTEFDGTSSSSVSSEVNTEDEGLHSQLVSYNIIQPTQNSLIIQALIQQVCKHMEQNKEKRRELYSAICRILNERQFLGLNMSLDELWPLKESFCHMLSKFFTQVHKSVASQGLGSCTSVSIRGSFDCVRTDQVHYSNRYQQSFEELEIIAKGGFGVVCKARNKVDDIVYAVKKIKFKYTNDLEFEKVLREVRSFAQLKHQNIVNYNHSWLETNITSESTLKTDSDSESGSSDSEQNTNSSSFRGVASDYVASPVVNLSLGTSTSNERNLSGQNSNLTSLLIDSINSSANIQSHSVVINSAIHILHKNVVIEENVENSETRAEWQNEICSENRFHDYSAGEPHQLTVCGAEHDTENGDADCNFICDQVDESGDCSQKISRRRRHSSGPTCSASDKDSEIDPSQKDPSHRKSYDRFNSLDLDPKRCALVPKATDTKWDISNLGVMAILYIQMELCDQSLRDWLDERESTEVPSSCCKPDMSIRNALEMFEQIVQGVEHIHSKSIIHRDLKPKNIFLCCDGSIKIGDFGLAALCTQTDTQEFYHTRCSCTHTQGLGTAPYSAPEQKNHNNYDTKVDIYSLGIILIELIHCYRTRMEFCRTVEELVEGRVPPEFVNIWPRQVVNLIQRLISKIPRERPEAKEILSYLQGLKMAESLAISNGHQDFRNKENETLEISRLKAQVRDLNRQLSEKDEANKAQIHSLEEQLLERDEKIKELQLKLLYMSNCDSFV